MISGIELLLVVTAGLLAIGTLGYHRDHLGFGRWGAMSGFALLGCLLVVLTIMYATSSRADRHFLMLVAGVGAVLSFHAVHLQFVRWDRAGQLTTMVTAIVLLLLPFELFPALQLAIQEFLAAALVVALDNLGYHAALEERDGAMMQLRFENDGFYYIARECTGIDGVAFFGGIVLGARTTWPRKLAGLAFVVFAVVLVNSLRLVFVGSAMAGNWFGPHLTSENTVQMTYYVAEVGIGQTAVVLASVAGFLLVARWIPDLQDFAMALLDTLWEATHDVNARVNPF